MGKLGNFADSLLVRIAIGLLGVTVVAALFAPWIAPQDPYDLAQLYILDARTPPMTRNAEGMLFLLGTDDQGRDVFSAILYGLRISLGVAFVATAIAVVLGTSIGLMSAYAGGRTDAVLMRIVDMQLSFPAVLIALMLVALLGTGIEKVTIAIVAVQWARYARTVRGAAMVEREREYVEAARCLAYGPPRIMFRHILPNCMAPLSILATVEVASAISIEATLSFLGVGLPITKPSLGLLIANGYPFMLSGNYWLSIYPGLVLIAVIIAINILGDRLREVLNPRSER
ncbi:MAG: ABC transporter permease [Kiloniellales bacterium]|nr:ABC transporter permease [Kiloniellales bacterium]